MVSQTPLARNVPCQDCPVRRPNKPLGIYHLPSPQEPTQRLLPVSPVLATNQRSLGRLGQSDHHSKPCVPQSHFQVVGLSKRDWLQAMSTIDRWMLHQTAPE